MSSRETPSLGQSIPPQTAHAVSVSLPTWKANIGYEEGERWVLDRMTTGYPRFFIHKSIESFADAIVQRHGATNKKAFLFPSPKSAARCLHFVQTHTTCKSDAPSIVDLLPNDANTPIVSAVLMSPVYAKAAKAFWQHTGEGISSRRAEYCHRAFDAGTLAAQDLRVNTTNGHTGGPALQKGPRRYQRGSSVDLQPAIPVTSPSQDALPNTKDALHFVEERFGRNLDISLAKSAKRAIRTRIAGAVGADEGCHDTCTTHTSGLLDDNGTEHLRDLQALTADDVYLFPCGMNAIFHAHQILMACGGVARSINYGFPYIDTLKILEKFGPGCLFYGHSSQGELTDLEHRCQQGERFLALFCEFPGNPLLKSPDLQRIRALADRYGFAVVVDETIGNFVNVNILPMADIIVSSLTKVFTGECNVMGGSMILNPHGPFYTRLKSILQSEYEDHYWPEDSIFMERNSRDFRSRISRINANAEAVCEMLQRSPAVKEVYYPKCSPSRPFYDQFKKLAGGYGGLLSVIFNKISQAIAFFDHIETAKGPSLGTNFTLSSPYVLLAHYGELDWTRQFGVEPDLVRLSIGLEEPQDLLTAVRHGLKVAEEIE